MVDEWDDAHDLVWMLPQHQIRDNHSMKIMAIMAERDNAIQERNIALAEKKGALAERDMAIIQRDAAIMERDNALTALGYTRENSIHGNNGSGYTALQGTKQFHQQQQPQQHLQLPQPQPQLSDALYIHAREIHVAEAYSISTASDRAIKGCKAKRSRKEAKSQAVNALKKAPTALRKGKKNSGGEDYNKLVTIAKPLSKWKGYAIGGAEDLNKQAIVTKQHEWKGQDLGLCLVTFDETTMPPPGCSCTGILHQCYKWGNGGWQSACCTTMMSMHPFPVIPNKRHARVAGRKMSGSAFNKLLSKLAAEGHDLLSPLDLKDHWARHGTNRYITIE